MSRRGGGAHRVTSLEADEAGVRVGLGGQRRGARVAGARVRVHRRQPRAALHQAVEVERDAVAGRAYLYARYFVVVA